MYYYAYINEQNICEEVYALPAAVTSDKFISIEKVLYDTRNVIGLKWTGSKWVEVEMYYYAVLIEKNFRTEVSKEDEVRYFVKEIVESAEKINDPLYIPIDELSSAKVGQLYNPDTAGFTEPEFVQEAFTDTNYISVNGTNQALTDKLNELESSIENIEIPEVTAQSIVEKLKTVDGTGSGVDADLLDGKDGTYFATDEAVKVLETKVDEVKSQVENIEIPEVTAQSIVEKLKTVDGASSGIDADLLDGKDSTYFATTQGLQDLTTVVNGKAAINHAHSNYASTVTTTGSGNAITAISQSGNTITATKGASYALSNHTHGNYASTITTTGSGNAITAISQSGNTITATKGATYALSSQIHTPNAVTVDTSYCMEIAVTSSCNQSTTAPDLKLENQVGGWKISSGGLIVPKTGEYLCMIDGNVCPSSGSISGYDGVRVGVNVFGDKADVEAFGYISQYDFGKIEFPISAFALKGLYHIMKLSAGEAVYCNVSLRNENVKECGLRVYPRITLVEI